MNFAIRKGRAPAQHVVQPHQRSFVRRNPTPFQVVGSNPAFSAVTDGGFLFRGLLVHASSLIRSPFFAHAKAYESRFLFRIPS